MTSDLFHVCKGCYGVPEEEGAGDDKSSLSSFTTIPWFCDACKAGVDPANCVSSMFQPLTVHAIVCSVPSSGVGLYNRFSCVTHQHSFYVRYM